MGLDTFIESLGSDSGFWLLLDGVSPQTWSHQIVATPKIIGRGHECDIVLLHQLISRRHAKLWLEHDQVYLQDLNSRNGTTINGERVSTTSVTVGTSIQIDRFTMYVVDLNQMRRNAELGTYVSTHAGTKAAHSDESVTFFLQQKRAEIAQLSKAQVRVLRLLLSGASEAEAAMELHRSPSTIHSHVIAIYKILGVNSRGGLMAKFINPKIAE